jgi:hypothetical protein
MKKINPDTGPVMKIDDQLYKRCTGTAEEFAWKIGVSVRTLFLYLEAMNEILKHYGVSITYNTKLKTYEYSRPGRFLIFCTWAEKGRERFFVNYNTLNDNILPIPGLDNSCLN